MSPARRGVTFLELLVVLVILSISAALVVPAIRHAPRDPVDNDPAMLPSNAVDVWITEVRRLAISRAQGVHARMETDGVWSVVTQAGGESLRSGQVASVPAWLPDMTVDAVGTCLLAAGVQAPETALVWDALMCRWRRESATGRAP